jgi:P27 family predicted phage terminase small subunit
MDKPIAASKWHELLQELQSRSLLATVDLGLFALFCEAWQCFSDASEEVTKEGLYFTTEKGYVGIHPAELVKDKAVKRIISLGDRLGIGVHARKGLHKSETGGSEGTAEQDPLVAYAKLKIK